MAQEADTHATQALVKRLALVLDFDGTLAPDSVGGFVDYCGLDSDQFWGERVRSRVEGGWDKMLAAFYALMEETGSHAGGERAFTRDRLVAYGQQLTPFDGVPEMFDRVRRHVRERDQEIEVEFYLLSSGIAEIARHSGIAGNFREVWGCELHYDDSGAVDFVQRFVSHTEKTRYLYAIAVGTERAQEDEGSLAAYAGFDVSKLRVPLTQMVYVGDGASDIPCFAVMNAHGGIALGVAKGDEARHWAIGGQVGAGERVANLAPPDFRDEGELMRSLLLAVDQIVSRIALLALSAGE